MEKVISGVESGAGLRVITGFRTIYAYTNDMTEKALLALAAEIARACGGSGSRDIVLDLREKRPPVVHKIIDPPEGVAVERKLALVKEADKAARAVDQRVAQVAVQYRDTLQKVTIACSDGTLAHDERYYLVAAVNAVAKDGSTVQTGYESAGGNIGFELFKEFPAVSIGDERGEAGGNDALGAARARRQDAGGAFEPRRAGLWCTRRSGTAWKRTSRRTDYPFIRER